MSTTVDPAAPAADPSPLLRAAERFLAAYHAHAQLVAEQSDWSLRILLCTPDQEAGESFKPGAGAPDEAGHAVAVQVVAGRGVRIEDRPQDRAAEITVTAELDVLIDVLELRKSPNEPYLFGELLVHGPEAHFLRLDYVVSSLCQR